MGSLFWSWIDRRATNLTFCRGAIGVSSELIIFTGLNEQPFLYRPGRHSFRDLAGMSGFTPIVACGLKRNDVAPCHEQRLLPVHVGCPVVRPDGSAPGKHRRVSRSFSDVN